MRVPKQSDLQELRGKPRQWAADWLRHGLNHYLFEGKGRRSFPGARNFVDQGEANIAVELAVIVEALDHDDRESFRAAVADLLQTLDFSRPRDAAIATYLIELGARIRARGIPAIIAQKSFTGDSRDGLRVFDMAFDFADLLADIEPESTVKCLRHLIGQGPPLFQPAFAGRALLALTKAAPQQFDEHYAFLKPALDAEYVLQPASASGADSAGRRHSLVASLHAIFPPGDRPYLATLLQPDGRPDPEGRNGWLDTFIAHFKTLVRECGDAARSPVRSVWAERWSKQRHAAPEAGVEAESIQAQYPQVDRSRTREMDDALSKL